jgi:hypothetical protein
MNAHGAPTAGPQLHRLGADWQRSPLGLHIPPTVALDSPARRGQPVAVDLFADAPEPRP